MGKKTAEAAYFSDNIDLIARFYTKNHLAA